MLKAYVLIVIEKSHGSPNQEYVSVVEKKRYITLRVIVKTVSTLNFVMITLKGLTIADGTR
jgi:hypothetical protein